MVSSIGDAPFQLPQYQNINKQTSVLLQEKDSNNNGTLSADEVDFSSDAFNKIDQNSDGEMDRTELNLARIESDRQQMEQLTQMVDPMTRQLIQDTDSDGSGTLSKDELGVNDELFNHIDKNQDGVADQNELNFARIESDIYNREQQLTNIDYMTRHLIQENDADQNGALSADELDADEELFNFIDQNQDGKADQNELNLARLEYDMLQAARNAQSAYVGDSQNDDNSNTDNEPINIQG